MNHFFGKRPPPHHFLHFFLLSFMLFSVHGDQPLSAATPRKETQKKSRDGREKNKNGDTRNRPKDTEKTNTGASLGRKHHPKNNDTSQLLLKEVNNVIGAKDKYKGSFSERLKTLTEHLGWPQEVGDVVLDFYSKDKNREYDTEKLLNIAQTIHPFFFLQGKNKSRLTLLLPRIEKEFSHDSNPTLKRKTSMKNLKIILRDALAMDIREKRAKISVEDMASKHREAWNDFKQSKKPRPEKRATLESSVRELATKRNWSRTFLKKVDFEFLNAVLVVEGSAVKDKSVELADYFLNHPHRKIRQNIEEKIVNATFDKDIKGIFENAKNNEEYRLEQLGQKAPWQENP